MKIKVVEGSGWYADEGGNVFEVNDEPCQLWGNVYYTLKDDDQYLFELCDVIKVEYDIIINTVSFPIEEILIPTKRDGFCNYRLDNTTETIVELWEDRKDLSECDRIGIFKEDIPLLIKGLETIYDEYMDAKNKTNYKEKESVMENKGYFGSITGTSILNFESKAQFELWKNENDVDENSVILIGVNPKDVFKTLGE